MSQIDWLNDYATKRDADAFARIVTQYQRLILAASPARGHWPACWKPSTRPPPLVPS